MKTAALITVSASAVLLSFSFSQRLKKRVKILETLLIFISSVQTKIDYTADRAEDIFSCACECENFSPLIFLGMTSGLIKNGEPINSAWKKGVEKYLSPILRRSDIELLVSFGEAFGTSDAAGQISNCQIHIEMLSSSLAFSREQCAKFSLPIKTAGLLTAAAVYIIFL